MSESANRPDLFVQEGKAVLTDFDYSSFRHIITQHGAAITNLLLIGNNWTDKDFELFPKLTNLTELSISLCPRLRDLGLVNISKCSSIERLDFCGLDLNASQQLTGAGVRNLAKLKKLEYLYLPSVMNKKDPSIIEAIKHIKAMLPYCIVEGDCFLMMELR